jgi:hypothetical protein
MLNWFQGFRNPAQPQLAIQSGTRTPWHSHALLHATQSVRTIKYAPSSEHPFPVVPSVQLRQDPILPANFTEQYFLRSLTVLLSDLIVSWKSNYFLGGTRISSSDPVLPPIKKLSSFSWILSFANDSNLTVFMTFQLGVKHLFVDCFQLLIPDQSHSLPRKIKKNEEYIF